MRRPARGLSALPAALAISGALAALSMALFAPSAFAAEDAGTRSIFASGAGNRALGMGGAFAGVADDASAMIWNPGGLAQLQRLEVQATHAAYDLGSHEEYVAAVMPDWRWGTAGLSVRYFGIDGIESRDDGNALGGANLSDTEMEIGLGYGRPLSRSLSLGGTVKLQRQSLAGFSGSGLGADIGVLGRVPSGPRDHAGWMERLSWGLSVRNVIQPRIRLDRESVADPSAVRAGAAYEAPSLFGRPAMVAVDLEKSPGMAIKAHAGFEFKVHPLLQIRGGFNAGRMTAGMGVAWRDFMVDYAFLNGQTTDIHRVGISRVLGRTSFQKREAAARAREAELQATLDDAFQKRQSEQLDDLLARVKTAQAEQDHDRALGVLATIAILYPNQAEARSLEAISLRAKQAEAESLRRRAAADSAAAVASGQALERKRIAAATPVPKPVTPKSTETAPKSPAQGTGPKVAERPPLTPEQVRMVEDLYRSGLTAMSERRPDDALRYWEMAQSIAPSYKKLAEYLKREYLIRGMDSFASGKVDQALVFWEKALEVDPQDPRASSYILRARTQQARTREIMSGGR